MPISLLQLFKIYLTQSKGVSVITAKNYVSDIRKFMEWFKLSFGKELEPLDITADIINLAIKSGQKPIIDGQKLADNQLSYRSLKRRLSSLRSFTKFLNDKGYLYENPFDQLSKGAGGGDEMQPHSDPWFLKEFKDYLYIYGGSKSTIKNYLLDIKAFASWFEESQIKHQPYDINVKNYIEMVTSSAIDNYKENLISVLNLSPRSVNRKLSSIRKYLRFAEEQGYVKNNELRITNYEERKEEGKELNLEYFKQRYEREAITEKKLSSFPPIRLIQRLISPYINLEDFISSYLARSINDSRLRYMGSKIVERGKANLGHRIVPIVANIPKEIYAPHEISLLNAPWHQKLIHHAKHRRPKWYKKYHTYPIVHYLHFAILMIYASILGFILYTGLFPERQNQIAAGGANAAARVLSFRGSLIDHNNNPITRATDLRFAIYNSEAASGSALLWQEEQQGVVPDENGGFSVFLGSRNTIPTTLFRDYDSLYLGITIEQTPELTPRQLLASVSYAGNSETLQGMLPITDSSESRNVILALDASGNLTIGGSSNPTFAATGGDFKLSGKTLVLATEQSSDGDINIIPDGIGRINIEKPLVNTGATGNLVPGSVEINDRVGVLATESAVAAFVINNDTTGGDIFTASSSGTTRFTIANDGDLRFAAGVSLDTISTGTLSIGNTKATTISLGRFGQEIVLPAFTGRNGVLYGSAGTGALSQVRTSTPSLCLLSGDSAPSWGNCNSIWGQGSGTIFSNNHTVDLLIGSQATASAEFSVTGIINGSPIVSIFATSNSNGLSLTGSTATIQSFNNNNLTIGGTTTGNVILAPVGGGGRVGINTTSPGQALEVNGDIRFDANGTATTNGLCHSGPNSDTTFADRDIVACSGAPADIAEWYETTSGVEEAGEILVATNNKITYMAQKTNPVTGELEGKVESKIAILTESTEPYQNNIIGIVSSGPYQTFGRDIFDYAKNPRAVALAGRVPLKVSTENGPIEIGDPITSSSIPGVGMKATKSGKIVGFALADFNGAGTGKIIVYISNSSYQKSIAGELKNLGEDLYMVADNAQDAVGQITIGIINAGNIFASTLNVATDSVTIAGQSLSDYITSTVKSILDTEYSILNTGEAIVSPLASIDKIQTNIISPLADNSSIAVSLHDSKFMIHDSAASSGAVVASIDNTGNATFSGSLTADSLQTTDATVSGELAVESLSANEASISGTLFADKIQANSIEGLEEKIESLVPQSVSSPSANIDLVAQLNTQYSILDTDFVDIQNLSSDFATFRQGLISLGAATFAQATAIESISIGASFIIGPNSINTLGDTLEIQPLKQGPISFMAGAVRIETDGTLKVIGDAEFAGDVTVAGKLQANVISPLPDSPLIIARSEEVATNSALLDIQGSASISGTLTSRKLNLALAEQAFATSDIEAIASGSAGTAFLKQYRNEITIKNQNVTENSLIYITPVGNTNGKVLYLLRQTPEDPLQAGVEGSFTVGINIPSTAADIKFNWIIVN